MLGVSNGDLGGSLISNSPLPAIFEIKLPLNRLVGSSRKSQYLNEDENE